jgi:hypothetical protein
VKLVLEFEIEAELGGKPQQLIEDAGKIWITGVADDAYTHQPARSRVPLESA